MLSIFEGNRVVFRSKYLTGISVTCPKMSLSRSKKELKFTFMSVLKKCPFGGKLVFDENVPIYKGNP